MLERASVKDESGNEVDLSALFPASAEEEEVVEEIEAVEVEQDAEPRKSSSDPTALPTL